MFQKQEATKRNEEMSEQKEHSVILQSFLLNLFCSDLQEGGERMKGGGGGEENQYTLDDANSHCAAFWERFTRTRNVPGFT